ncbi:MAG: hypothetical protein WCF85_00150 [Rhodospirillaceae bacterium]
MATANIRATDLRLKPCPRRVGDLDNLLERALDLHAEVSDAVAYRQRWNAGPSVQALSEVLIGLLDIVRAQHGLYDEFDEGEDDLAAEENEADGVLQATAAA